MQYKIDELILKYLCGSLTEEEQSYLDEWKSQPGNRQLLDQLSNADWVKQELRKMQQIREDKAYRRLSQIYAQQDAPIQIGRARKNRAWYWAAATLLLLVTAGTLFLLSRKDKDGLPGIATAEERFRNDVEPGSNKATLTLANGNNITLDSTTNGLLAQQGNTAIINSNNGQVAYQKKEGNTENGVEVHSMVYNTITTPHGGQYMVVLPDGSKAWLNSASSLRFPTAFTEKERVVELTGEGYFEVASSYRKKDKSKIPFTLKAGTVAVEVLGTHFNVNAYIDEEEIITTLLEGAVQVKGSQDGGLLKPGEQAQVNKQGTLKKTKPDLEPVMAWRNGLFSFKNASIASIMRQAQRWYGIEVVYESKVNKEQALNGDIPRNVALSKFLKILEATGSLHFQIVGKRVIVMP
ncbi:MAG: FecR domain-containing protein [Niastella sp.]|nr:FecR domain-containing protein [Niastella sp.]